MRHLHTDSSYAASAHLSENLVPPERETDPPFYVIAEAITTMEGHAGSTPAAHHQRPRTGHYGTQTLYAHRRSLSQQNFAAAFGQRAAGRNQQRMGNRKNLPQPGTPKLALSLMLKDFTEEICAAGVHLAQCSQAFCPTRCFLFNLSVKHPR